MKIVVGHKEYNLIDGRLVMQGGTGKSRFRVHLPRVFGFCNGVVIALRKIERELENPLTPNRKIYLLGEIIHNTTVNERLAEDGVSIIPNADIEKVFDIVDPEDTVVIPAFGIPEPLDRKIRRRHKGQIIDTTCGNVRKVWDFVAAQAEQRATVILHARPDHPEAAATISRAVGKCNAAVIVPSEAAASVLAGVLEGTVEPPGEGLRWTAPEHFSRKKLALANQTTMSHDETLRIASVIRAAAGRIGAEFTVCDTICEATKKRQDAARELCQKKIDVFLVVGGYDSSNTRHLYEIARLRSPTYYVRDADAFGSEGITHFLPDEGREVSRPFFWPEVRDIGVLAGASCPPDIINDIVEKLLSL